MRLFTGPRLRGSGRRGRRADASLPGGQAVRLRALHRGRLNFPSRAYGVRARGISPVRGERRLGPVVDDAASGAWHKLPRAVVDQADDLRARFVVETARRKDLRDLLAELAIALEGSLDV